VKTTATAVIVLVLVAGLLPPAAGGSLRKRVIVTGWDNPTTAEFRRSLRDLEKWPIDGVVVRALASKPGGGDFDASRAFSTSAWDRGWFSQASEDLRETHSATLTENFLLCGANPGDVDWFDDLGWGEVVRHIGTLAWLARRGGMRGLVFDPEAYTPPSKQFDYRRQTNRERYSFEEYAAKVRQRGRDVMRAVAAEFPDVVLLSYYLLSYCSEAVVAGADPSGYLAEDENGLLPAFLDGWLDVLPQSCKVVDGNEHAYLYNSELRFDGAFVRIKGECQALISAENRYRYRGLVQVGHGLFLDAYINAPGSAWFIDPHGESKAGRFGDNLRNAIVAADEYVWLYGQKGRWWPPLKPGMSWPDLIPGISLAITGAKDPREGAIMKLADLRRSGALVSLLRNAELRCGADAKPAYWSTWQEDGSRGRLTVEVDPRGPVGNVACVRGARNGCFIQTVEALPGQHFLLAVRAGQEGNGLAYLLVRWKSADGEWLPQDESTRFVLRSSGQGSPWSEIAGQVVAPDRARRLVLMLGARDQRETADLVRFSQPIVADIRP
jgi:hypothetical protein